MSSSLHLGTQTEDWKNLVSDAAASASIELNEDMESYLVFLLLRYLRRPDITSRVVSLDYLHAFLAMGARQKQQMQEVGDICLLYSGIYPQRARRKQVRISFFIRLGQTAYASLAEIHNNTIARLYEELAQQFVPLMETLHAMRNFSMKETLLEPLEAFELWQDTGSRKELERLQLEHASCLPELPSNKH